MLKKGDSINSIAAYFNCDWATIKSRINEKVIKELSLGVLVILDKLKYKDIKGPKKTNGIKKVAL